MRLGALYFDSGRYSEALEMFKQSLKLWPGDLKTLLLGGEVYLRLNNVEKAVKMFSTVLRLQPGNEIAKKILAQINAAGSSVPGKVVKSSPSGWTVSDRKTYSLSSGNGIRGGNWCKFVISRSAVQFRHIYPYKLISYILYWSPFFINIGSYIGIIDTYPLSPFFVRGGIWGGKWRRNCINLPRPEIE